MTRTEKDRSTVGAVERSVETEAPCKMTTASTSNDTTDGAGRQPPRISDLLHPGAENAVPRRDLMALTGLPDRMLRRQIEAERRLGTPILSDCVGGYYLPGSDRERAECVRSMRRRSAEIARTADAIEQAEV